MNKLNLTIPYTVADKELIGEEVARLFALQGLNLAAKTQAYFVDEISSRAYPLKLVVKVMRTMARYPMDRIKVGEILANIYHELPK